MVERLKILIIRSGAIGDTLMIMPLINGLCNHQIIILGRKPGIDYIEPYVDQCIDIERGGWHRLFNREEDIDIPFPEADHVIAFLNDKDNIVCENLDSLFADSKINIFPPFPDPDSQIHVALHMANAIQSAGIPVDPRKVFDAALIKPVMKSGKKTGKKIVFHPGSGSKKKNYSPDFWFRLFENIQKESPGLAMRICFLLGPAEEEITPIIKGMAEEYDAEIAIVLCPEKEELLAILNNTYLYIGHDSGITHLSAMLGINTIALFKNRSIKQWRPLGPSVKIIKAEGDEEKILDVTAGEVSKFFIATFRQNIFTDAGAGLASARNKNIQ